MRIKESLHLHKVLLPFLGIGGIKTATINHVTDTVNATTVGGRTEIGFNNPVIVIVLLTVHNKRLVVVPFNLIDDRLTVYVSHVYNTEAFAILFQFFAHILFYDFIPTRLIQQLVSCIGY